MAAEGVKWVSYAFLSLAIAGEVLGTILLVRSSGFTRLGPGSVTVIAYVVAYYCFGRVIAEKSISVAVAYGIWSAAGIVVIAIIDVTYFREKLAISKIVGLVLIVIGIVVIHLPVALFDRE